MPDDETYRLTLKLLIYLIPVKEPAVSDSSGHTNV